MSSSKKIVFGLALQCLSMHGSAFGIIAQNLLCVVPFPQFCVINCKCHNALWFMFLTLIELFKELLLSMEKNLPLLKTTFSLPLLHCGVLTKGMLINMSEKLFQYNSSTLFTHLSVTRQFLKKGGLQRIYEGMSFAIEKYISKDEFILLVHFIKHEYLRSRASTCMSLSLTSSSSPVISQL